MGIDIDFKLEGVEEKQRIESHIVQALIDKVIQVILKYGELN
ncbi:Uncharacterised protein [Serratia quinivorans]|nr:hypothetical protein [Serratia quinivorans]SPZ65741.1 Uncharacterised protein [Serratia quinivorans]VEI74146.1 Uncharacterised protein [Serratia quinivorans]